MVRRFSCGPIACWIFARTFSLITWSLYEMRSILRYNLIPIAFILLWSSALMVHDSQAYRKMDVTRGRISRILELREKLLSFQTGLNLVNAAVVCAIMDSISCLEPSSVITEPSYLKCDCHRVLVILTVLHEVFHCDWRCTTVTRRGFSNANLIVLCGNRHWS